MRGRYRFGGYQAVSATGVLRSACMQPGVYCGLGIDLGEVAQRRRDPAISKIATVKLRVVEAEGSTRESTRNVAMYM